MTARETGEIALADTQQQRETLRRATRDLNGQVMDLYDKLDGFDSEAADAVRRARSALFEAWTILCTPPEDEDEDHDY